MTFTKQADGTLSGSLTEEKVKDLLLMGRRSDTPPKDLKGSVRFWLKEGALAKYEFNVQGKVPGRDGQAFDLNRTTTVEINLDGSQGPTSIAVSSRAWWEHYEKVMELIRARRPSAGAVLRTRVEPVLRMYRRAPAPYRTQRLTRAERVG